MILNIDILGLIIGAVGTLIIIITEMINPRYIKVQGMPFVKRYSYRAWQPIYNDTQTHKWKVMLNHRPRVYGMIPPKYKLEILGTILFLIGIALQIV